MRYGTFPPRIVDDQTDLIGIRTLILAQTWQASRDGLSQQELDEEEPPVPPATGDVVLIGKQTRPKGGGLRTVWTFEGINGDRNGPAFRTRVNSLDYKFDPAFAQVSIIKSPRWKIFTETYGGYVLDGQVIFPEAVPDATGGQGLGAKGAKKADEPNPLFGHEDFYRLEGTYSFRYAARTLAGLFRGVEQIHTTASLPGTPPAVEDGRNWLKPAPTFQRRGPVFDITETYWLSGAGGWPKEIYGPLPGGSGGGLQTGTVTPSEVGFSQ